MDEARGDMMGSRLRRSHPVDKAAYERDVKRNEVFYRRNYLNHMPEDKTAPILEIGCGLGQFLSFCRACGYTSASGVDMSTENVAFCRERSLTATLSEGGEYLTRTSCTFGAIVMNDVIEHIPKDGVLPLLRRVLDRLQPGGVLIMKTINAANPLLGPHGRYNDFTHELSWTEESMRQVLEGSGFVGIRVAPSNLYVFYANPLNYIALAVAKLFELFFFLYFRLHGRVTTKIFTKNLIAVARKPDEAGDKSPA